MLRSWKRFLAAPGRRSPIAAALVLPLLAVAPTRAELVSKAASPGRLARTPECRFLQARAAGPIGIGGCSGVRPGASVRTRNGLCTFNFLFGGSDGRRYIGTAGHCVLAGSGFGGGSERRWAAGAGPAARDGSGRRIGEFAYAEAADRRDFALIRLDRRVRASPRMCHFGGPTGLNNSRPAGPVLLQYYGNGVPLGAIAPARTGVALGMPNPNHVYMEGLAAPGDSGAGVVSADERAVGVLSTLGVHIGSIGFGTVDAGLIGIARIGPALRRAERRLGIDLTLRTARPL